jgi:hypothetical protein
MAVENSITKDVATIRESTDDANSDKYDIGHAAALLVMLLTDTFPFDGERCLCLTARALNRLKLPPGVSHVRSFPRYSLSQ